MNILIVSGIYPPDIGGPATYVHAISEEMRKWGHDVHVLTLGDRDDTDEVSYISRKPGILRRSQRVKRFVESYDADLVFCQDPLSMGLGVGRAKTKARKIIKVVGDNAWEISRESLGVTCSIKEFQSGFHGIRPAILRFLQRRTARRFDTVITPSKYMKRIVAGWGIPENSIVPIYNAVKKKSAEDLEQTKDHLPYFLYVGRLAPWKGVDTAIEAIKSRKENLVVIGDGSDEQRLKDLAKHQDNVHFLGRRPNKEVRGWMRDAEALILISGYEGFPHVVLESFMESTPAICSDVCGNPEIIDEGGNGFLVPFGDPQALKHAMQKIRDAKDLGKGADESAERFSWKHMTKELREVIE